MTLGYLFFNFALSLLEMLLSIVLLPINLLLEPFIPNSDLIVVHIHNLFDFLSGAIQFILGWLHLPNEAISLINGYIGFLLIYLPISIGFKLVIKFYRVFKP